MGCGQSQSEYGEFKNELKPDSSDGSRDPSPTPTKPDSDGLDEEEEEDEEDREEDEESEPRDDERSTDSEEPEDEPRKDSKSEEEAGPVAVQRESLSSAEAIHRAAVSGRIAVEYPITAKVVRIFTSSTFTDTKVERNALMERVYPKLRTFCQELGYEFQVVDMRWGVRDEATDDHLTSELCMREIKQCQTLSTGPNFITFLSQKYGYRPFPPKIKSDEFELIFEKLECEEDQNLLSDWFKEDENSVPKQYLLQPIRTKLKHYADDSDQDKKKQDRDTWWAAFEKMQVLLRDAASKAFTDGSIVHKYYWAVTEEEIYHGILQAKNIDNCCHWFRRQIHDLSDNTKDKMARRFMDISGGVDEEALRLLTKLKEEMVPQKLPERYITDYKVDWTDKGIDYEHPGHKQYIDGFCVDFDQTLRKMIHNGIADRGHKEVTDPLILECIQHLQFGQKKSDQFHGRKDFLSMLKNLALNDDTSGPILICGQPGSGKTSIMAKLVSEVQEWQGGCDVIVRFLGTTSQSNNTRNMLTSLCKQIARLSNEDEDVPKDMKGLSERFKSLIGDIEKPVVILLDSLDQLHDFGGQVKDWVPTSLEENVTFIMSAIPAEQYEVVPKLKNLLEEENIRDVPDMPASDISLILKCWFMGAGRCLTPDQQIVVEKTCCALPLPLYMKLIYDEAAIWRSYTLIEDTKLGVTLQEAIENLLEKVEKYHGSVLVRRALAYITAAKNGLGSNEIEDVLSLDDVVLNSVYQYHMPPTRRLPPLLWVRIQFDLRDFLVTSGADNIQVTRWYHRQFTRVANERYLSEVSIKKEIHQLLGEYFSGEWADGRAKPFVDKKGVAGEQTRFVAPQPLVIKEEGETTIYNLRKLREFPYHLTLAGMVERLKKDTILNFEWINNKIQATDIDEVLDDFQFAIDNCNDKEVEMVHHCLHLSRSAVLLDSNTLPSQLTGRLYSEDINGMECVKQLLHSALRPDFDCMISTQGGLAGSGAALVNTFAGHEGDVTCLAVNGKGTKLLTYSSYDGMLKVWDMKKGNEIESHEPYGCGRVRSMQFYHGDKRVVLASEDRLSLHDLVVGQLIVTIDVDEDEDRTSLCHAWDKGNFVALAREVEIIIYELSSNLKEKDRIPLKRDTEGNTEVREEDIFIGWENYVIRYFKSCPDATIATIGPSTSLKKYPIMSKKEMEHVAVCMATSSAGLLAIYCYGQIHTTTGKNRDPYDPFMDIIDIKTLSKLHTFKGFIDNPFAQEKYLVPIGPRSFVFERDESHDKFMMVVDVDTKSLSTAVQLHATRYRHLIGSQDIYLTISFSDPHVVQAINVRKAIIARAKKSEESEELCPDPGNLVKMMFGSKRYAFYYAKSNVEMCVWDVVKRKTVALLDSRLLTDGKIKDGHFAFSHMSVAVVSETEIIVVCPGNSDRLIGVDLVTNKLTFNLTGVAYSCPDLMHKCVNIGRDCVAFIGPKSFQVSVFNHKTQTVEKTISYSKKVKMSELVACKTGQIALTTDIRDMSSYGQLTERHVYVFDLENGTCLKTIVYKSEFDMANPMHTSTSTPSAALTPDGTFYIVSNQDEEFICKDDPKDVGGTSEEEVQANWRVYNLRTGEQRGVPPLTDHQGYEIQTNTVMYSQATHAFLGAYSGGNIALWDETTLKCTSKFRAFDYDDIINYMTLSSDGAILACSPNSSYAVILCDLILGQKIMQFRSDSDITGMLFSAEDKFLLLVWQGLKFIYELCLHRSEDMKNLPPDTILHDHYLKSIQGQDLYGNK